MEHIERTQTAEGGEEFVANAGRRRFARQALFGLAAAAGAAFAAAPQAAQAGSSADSWKMEGNGNVDANDFIGTTNAQPLVIKTNAQQRLTVHPNGDVSIGDPFAVSRLFVKADLSNGVAVRGDTAGTQAYATGVMGALNGVNQAGADYPAAVRGVVVNPANTAGMAVVGWHKGDGTAVLGRNASPSLRPTVVGLNTAASGNSVAVYGKVSSTASGAKGVWGEATSGSGVYGSAGSSGKGVYARGGTGLYAQTDTSNGIAVYAMVNNASSTGRALFAYMPPGAPGLAAEFWGNVKIKGNLTYTGAVSKVAAAITTMDHPLDPENRTLSLAEVASPELKVVYDGVVTLDDRGRATVELPAYVAALTGDFRYQLTAIGAPMPKLHVAAEVAEGRFAIAGGKPRQKVAWQVTGVRADAYAKANPLVAEAEKPAEQRGTYLSPEAFGLSAERGADFARDAAALREAGALEAPAALDLKLPASPTLDMPAAPLD